MSTPKVYYLPVKPDDPNADCMTIQETAYVLRISVTTLRRIFKDDKECRLHSRHRRSIVTYCEDRDRIRRLLHGEAKAKAKAKPRSRPKAASRRPRRTVLPTPAKPAA